MRARSQQSLVLALLAFAAVLAVAMLVASRGSIAQRTTLEQRIARVMQLDEEEEAPAEGEEGEEGEEEEAVLPEQLRTYLKVSADSIGYSCGGKEVADVCLMGAETCVASMQKKNRYTVSQSIARDMGTCSCFMDNGCSNGCNTAMMSMFGGYVSVADCPLSSSPYMSSFQNPYDMYGGGQFDSAFNDPGLTYSTAGAMYKANPRQEMLAMADPQEPVYVVSKAMRMRAQRKA
ncbi:hypothetical protein T484DRAFT_1910227 [Baffinella frigidus]|nr:hypothetical protein T484DRAFT_1910227 [Cryptophyta sp. CCMP2293]